MTAVDAAIRAVHQIGEMPYGLARTQAAEQALRTIEAEGPAEVVPYALTTLVDSMFWAGEPERSFVPFTRLVRLWDEHPEHFDEQDRHTLFWIFKWMVADLMEFPTVPAAQIQATIEDMARRYTVEGLGMNAVAHQRFMWAEELGDTAASDAAFDAWCATPRDDFSQCRSCEPGDRAAYLLDRGRYAEVVRVVESALADSPRCATEPADMLSHLQLAYLALGRDADAARTHRRAVAELANATGEMAGVRGRLVEFLARSGNDDAALLRIERDQALLVACETPRARLGFLIRAGVATHLICAAGGAARELALDAPTAEAIVGGGPVTVGVLDGWLRREATAVAAQFDERNGTPAASRLVEVAWSAERPDRVVDLGVLRLETADDRADQASARSADDEGGEASPAQPDEEAALLAAAHEAADEGRHEDASVRFAAVAQIAEEAGRLGDAGWALANAAKGAQLSADDAGAATAYLRALALLEAAGTPPDEVLSPLMDLAKCAAGAGRPLDALPVVENRAAAIDALLAAPDDDDVAPELAERVRGTRRRARAELTDLAARLRASAGDHAAAAALAEEAAVALAGLGAVADAAHAFWLAGRAHVALGDPATAAWHLESAVEGFEICGEKRERADVASELIAALRAAGRADEADAVQP